MNDKSHYYLFSYTFENGNGSMWVGLSSQKMSLSTLNGVTKSAEKSLPVGTKVCVTGATYLGHMTQEEFMDEDTQSS